MTRRWKMATVRPSDFTVFRKYTPADDLKKIQKSVLQCPHEIEIIDFWFFSPQTLYSTQGQRADKQTSGGEVFDTLATDCFKGWKGIFLGFLWFSQGLEHPVRTFHVWGNTVICKSLFKPPYTWQQIRCVNTGDCCVNAWEWLATNTIGRQQFSSVDATVASVEATNLLQRLRRSLPANQYSGCGRASQTFIDYAVTLAVGG